MARAGRTGLLVSTAMVRVCVRRAQFVQRLQRIEHAFVRVGEVQLVLAIVTEKKLVGVVQRTLHRCAAPISRAPAPAASA